MWGAVTHLLVADVYFGQIVTRDRLRAASLVMGRIAQEYAMTLPEDSCSPHDVRKQTSSRSPSRWLILLLVAVLITPIGAVVAGQLASNTGSPATGHAQVITQGIAEMAGQDVVWRLVERTAQPRAQATFGDQALGFVLASEEPVLLTNATGAGDVNVARLAPGEAFLVNSGTRQKRASMTDQAVTFLSLELVARSDVNLVGEGKLIFTTDSFTAPTGSHDLDLVRDVLTGQDETIIPDSGQSNVILASEGAIDVVPSVGQMRTLQAGEAGIFQGELRIRPSASALNADKPLLAAMTQPLAQNTSGPRTAFVAGVIGVEIPPVATDTPTSVPVLPTTPPEAPTLVPVTPEPTDTPSPTPTETPTETATATATETIPVPPTDTPTQEPIGFNPNMPKVILQFPSPNPTEVVIK
jgi:hypothetical protein